jgi:hypothetical protein
MSMDDSYTVRPHVLRKDADGREEVAVATVDGVRAVIVPVSEEYARGVIGATGFEGMEAYPAAVEEIEAVCAEYGLATVGLFGLDDGEGLDVLSVETVGMCLTEEP